MGLKPVYWAIFPANFRQTFQLVKQRGCMGGGSSALLLITGPPDFPCGVLQWNQRVKPYMGNDHKLRTLLLRKRYRIIALPIGIPIRVRQSRRRNAFVASPIKFRQSIANAAE
jgi:hypothetical protein